MLTDGQGVIVNGTRHGETPARARTTECERTGVDKTEKREHIGAVLLTVGTLSSVLGATLLRDWVGFGIAFTGVIVSFVGLALYVNPEGAFR